MKMMRKLIKNQITKSGQALIIILLVMAISLTLGVSVASRSISTLRQITFSAQSAKALAFAEAGAEEALKCLSDESCSAFYDPPAVDITGDGNNDFDYQITVLGQATVFDDLPPIDRDSTIELNLVGYPRFTEVSIYFVDRASSDQMAADPGLEVSLIYCNDDGATCTTGNYKLQRSAFDTDSGRSNGIPKLVLGSYSVGGTTYGYRVIITTPMGGSKYPTAMRLRLLYATEPISMAAATAGGAIFPTQGAKIESTGFSGQVKRKVEIVRLNPALSELFDFALFSGSDSSPLSR